MQNQAAKNSHIDGLDALRVFAILGITFFHFFPETVKGGFLGVSLFFLLTGYLLAYTSEKARRKGTFRVMGFYGKRILRIYPPLLLVLFISLGVFSFFAPELNDGIRPELFSILGGYNNWWQIAQNADYFTRLTSQSPFTHLWFLGVELQYCLIWPLLFGLYVLLERWGGRRLAIGVFVLLFVASAAVMPYRFTPGADVTRLYYGTDTRLYAFLLGAVLGFLRVEPARVTFLSARTQLAGIVVFLFFLCTTTAAFFLLDGQEESTYQYALLLWTVVLAVMLFLMADPYLPIGSFFEGKVWRWLGARSYGVYLWQYPVIVLFAKLGGTLTFPAACGLLLVILLLACWSDAFVTTLRLRKIPLEGQRFLLLEYVLFLLVSVPMLFYLGCGVKAAVCAPAQRTTDTAELKAHLEQNKQGLEAANEAAKQSVQGAQDLSGVALIGDSVLLGASEEVRKVLPSCYIDAEVSRYVGDGLAAAQNLSDHQMLGNIVVVALGTNGPLARNARYEEQVKALMSYLGPDRKIFWVNVYAPSVSWQDENNSYIAHLSETYPNVTYIDWYSLIKDHPEWLTDDHIHPNLEGRRQYAKLIHDAIAARLAREAQP
jgi:peptidoglycan/LPS O-acetylase OafA/YrhL